MLEKISINPKKPIIGSVIWLHGLGADGHNFEPIIPDLQPFSDKGLRFILPHAPLRPVTLFNGMPARAWFDLFMRNGEYGFIQSEIDAMAAELQHIVTTEMADFHLRSEQIILAGFSQGGAMAVYAALHLKENIGGVIGLSTFLPHAAELLRISPHRWPAFIAHGSQDAVVPFSSGVELSHALSQAGCPVTWQNYTMSHGVNATEVQDIRTWLAQVISSS